MFGWGWFIQPTLIFKFWMFINLTNGHVAKRAKVAEVTRRCRLRLVFWCFHNQSIGFRPFSLIQTKLGAADPPLDHSAKPEASSWSVRERSAWPGSSLCLLWKHLLGHKLEDTSRCHYSRKLENWVTAAQGWKRRPSIDLKDCPTS